MDELALIDEARQGDIEAFNTLVLKYQSLVYNLAYRILGDGAAADDATQQAFISAYRSLNRFRGGAFKSWLLRILTNACYDELRRHKRRPTTSLEGITDDNDGGGDDGPLLIDSGEGPEAYAQRQDLNRAIQRGLDILPADQRIVLVLSDIQGMSYEEIVDATGANLGTVKSRLSRARGRMRDYLLSQRELLPSAYRLQSEEGGRRG